MSSSSYGSTFGSQKPFITPDITKNPRAVDFTKRIPQIIDLMELIKRIAITDYQVAYEMHEIDPIRLFRYYKSIGVFTTSKKSPKYRGRSS